MGNQVTNPVVIMLINMTIVFAVLFLLSLFIRFIHFIDPTKPRTKKKTHPTAAPAKPKKAAPAKAAEPAAPVVAPGISGETVAAIAGALAAYGVGFSQIKAIRPAERRSWAGAARIRGLRNDR